MKKREFVIRKQKERKEKIYKLFTKLLTNKISTTLNSNQP